MTPQKHTKTRIWKQPYCDVCKQSGIDRPAEYDAKTIFGPWAYLCEEHYRQYGIRLGLGYGQRLEIHGQDRVEVT